ALLLDEDFGYGGQVSWTNYHADGAYYSGDLTDATDGATEFIDVPLATVSARYIVPQVNVFSGEGFDEVDLRRRHAGNWRVSASCSAACSMSPCLAVMGASPIRQVRVQWWSGPLSCPPGA